MHRRGSRLFLSWLTDELLLSLPVVSSNQKEENHRPADWSMNAKSGHPCIPRPIRVFGSYEQFACVAYSGRPMTTRLDAGSP